MDIKKAIQTLEALASGCSPITGEILDNDSILNERNVIRALQIAIDKLKTNESSSEVEIDEEDIKNVVELFQQENERLTTSKLAGFFHGTRKFKNQTIISNLFYGKYQQVYKKGQLLDFFTQYLSDNRQIKKRNGKYEEIDFFEKERFNRLSEKAIDQLKGKVVELGIQKKEDLSEYVQNARIKHFRAYEPWTDAERQLLKKALEYTNHLDLLSECFQRGKGSIQSYGQRLIYESQIQNNEANKD